MTTVINTSTSLRDTRQKTILTKGKYMKPKWPTSQKLVPGSPFTGQNVRLASPPLAKKTFLTLGQFRGIFADVTVYIFADLHKALRKEGNLLDIN